MPTFAIAGLTYYYEQIGQGPTLLLLHGFTGSAQNWSPVIEALKSTHTLVAPDLPGHGRTSAPDEPARYTMPAVAAHLHALLDHLQHPTAHLLGYSMGGRLALYLAQQDPQRWRSLILESASPGLATSAERQERIANDEALARFVEQNGIEAFVDRWEALPLFASQQDLAPQVRLEHRALRLQNRPAGLANSLRGMGTGAQPSLWPALSGLHLPVLLVAGSLDRKFVDLAQRMALHLPDARVEIMPGAGHTVHLEKPDAYCRLLQHWLSAFDETPLPQRSED
jgi:2-succinyl-6-hydroxy-2,4-cyclohexadiene-1-carboxylate synthase